MAQEFITQFHNIEGISIGVRQRNFNYLLKNVTFTPEEKQFLFDNLKPKTYVENLFYIDVLIRFRETSRLLEIFKEGNGPFVSKIMRQPWFFQEAFGNVAPKTLVDAILPSLSHSMKIKLLKSLSYAYAEKAIDKIFDHTIDKYGLCIAATFITACSSEKIEHVFKEFKVKLSSHQLKKIFRKNYNLIMIYFDAQKQYSRGNIFDNNFLTCLAQECPLLFWKVLQKCDFNDDLQLGRRTTKKVIPVLTHDIVSDPFKYINHLRQETLVRKLNKAGEFKQFYYNMFPRKIEILPSGGLLCNELLKYYPKTHRYHLFTTTFCDVMKDDIWHFSDCIKDDLMMFIPDVKVRESWALLKYKESSNEEYLKFYEVEKCFSIMKKKINTTSCIKSRRKFLCIMVKSCAINKDLKALEELLKYFCVRHRNDNKLVRIEFLEEIERNFNLEELDSRHWKYINEIFTIQSLLKEYDMHYSKLRVKHIEYLFNNNCSGDDKEYAILEYIKGQVVAYRLSFNALDAIKKIDIVKTILLKTTEHIENFIKNQHKEVDCPYLKSQLMGKIFWFNVKYPNNAIDIQENKMVVEFLKGVSKENLFVSYECEKYFLYMICKSNRNEFYNELLDFYLRDVYVREICFCKALKWFLKYDPMVVLNNFNSIMKNLPSKRYFIWNKIKRYSHLNLDKMVVKYCADKLHVGEIGNISEFVEPLSVLGSPEYYLKMMEDLNLIPISPKVVVDGEESKKVYDFQKTFLQQLKNFSDPLKYLPLLINKFCQGDYLNESLAPLYYAFHKIPESKLENYLDELGSNSAISVKKHAFYLACYMFDDQKVSQIFDSFQDSKSESLQKCLFLSYLRYTKENSKLEHFERMVSYMKVIKQFDTESLKIVTSSKTIVGIPKYFKSSYVISIWNLLEKLRMNDDATGFGSLMSTVLENTDFQCVSNLPEDFCRHIIDSHFIPTTNDKDEKVPGIFQFVIKYLRCRQNQTDNYTYIFGKLSHYKKQLIDSNGKERDMIKKLFHSFFTTACKKEVSLDFVILFAKEWSEIFTPTDAFKEYILLQLLRLKKEAQNDRQLYSQHIVLFSEQINDTYGEFVLSKFILILNEFFDTDNKKSEIMTNMLKYKASTLNCVLVIELVAIQGGIFFKNRVKPEYQEINSILNEVRDPKVKLCYNLYLKS